MEFKKLAPLVLVFSVLLVLLPRTGKFDYDYKKGVPWAYETLKSEVDFPILKTQQQIQDEMEKLGGETVPYFRYSRDVQETVRNEVASTSLGEHEELRPALHAALAEIYQSGVLPDETGAVSNATDRMVFVQKGKRAEKLSSSSFLTQSEAMEWLREQVDEAAPRVNADSLLSASNIYSLIRPNLLFDKEATERIHQNSVDYISPTAGLVERGTVIVESGEIVTEEVLQMLDSYKEEYNRSVGYNGPRALLWLGNAFIALILVLLLVLVIYFTNVKVFDDNNRYLYLLMVFLLSAIATLLVDRYAARYIYLIPYSLIALYLIAFFKRSVVMPSYIVSLLPLLLFSHNGPELFMMHLFAGLVSMYTFKFLGHGWLQFVNSMVICLVLLFTWFTFRLVGGNFHSLDYNIIIQIVLGSFFCVLGYPFVYLFEIIFNLVSDSRLQDLSDTNRELLRFLAKTAPGTFQHSLQVANLADAAARSIGANILLTRAGALYHDIGKTCNPVCFVENQMTEEDKKYHSNLTPAESASAIISHVSNGYAIAQKKHLPDAVSAFITTHHGTTPVEFFLNKYLNGGGDPNSVDDFYYKGEIPKTKEQSIVMICDTLEAASRTLPDYGRETVSNFVEQIVNKKLNQGQLKDSELTQQDIGIIKETLKNEICNLHHARIRYPKRRF